jgi:hypothetical protein
MKPLIGLTLGLGACAMLALAHEAAHAQFGFIMLPKDDFTWNWGEIREGQSRDHADIDVTGYDQGFDCHLTAKLRPSSNMTISDIRDAEMQLRQALEFVRASAEYMQYLDYQRTLEWATLECKQPKPEQVTEEEKLERETKARERMQREVERRRARQQNAE